MKLPKIYITSHSPDVQIYFALVNVIAQIYQQTKTN